MKKNKVVQAVAVPPMYELIYTWEGRYGERPYILNED